MKAIIEWFSTIPPEIQGLLAFTLILAVVLLIPLLLMISVATQHMDRHERTGHGGSNYVDWP